MAAQHYLYFHFMPIFNNNNPLFIHTYFIKQTYHHHHRPHPKFQSPPQSRSNFIFNTIPLRCSLTLNIPPHFLPIHPSILSPHRQPNHLQHTPFPTASTAIYLNRIQIQSQSRGTWIQSHLIPLFHQRQETIAPLSLFHNIKRDIYPRLRTLTPEIGFCERLGFKGVWNRRE